MPLFSGKFTPKKSQPRKSGSLSTIHREFDTNKTQSEFGLDYGPITISLANRECQFDCKNGEWIWSKHEESENEEKTEIAKTKKQKSPKHQIEANADFSKLQAVNKKLAD